MRIATLLLPAAFLLLAAAHTDDQAQLKAKLDEKLAKEFVKKGGWRLNYDDALKEAEKTGKPLFI